ncbi:MAG: iron uptake porin, partial [Synechococcaceae cyanobacterium]|nr:iron uptake porin [Synechococcaceae cyanobacterium]
LKRLMKEFEKELAIVRGRVDGLEAKVGELEATQFSTTTTLQGKATMVLGAIDAGGDLYARPGFDIEDVAFLGDTSFGGPLFDSDGNRVRSRENYNRAYGATTFSYDYRFELNTSFTGKDLLFTRLRAGNFDNAFNGNGVNLTALDIASDSDNDLFVDRLYYRFPFGSQFEFAVGPRARNTEFLGAKPGVYGSGQGDKILDYFAVWGVPGTYNKATGAFGGVIWRTPFKFWGGKFSATANYVAPNGNLGGVRTDDNDFSCNSSEGGIGNDCSRASFLAQLGWTSKQFGISGAYRYGQRGSNFRRGTEFVRDNGWWLRDGSSDSVAVNAYWQPRNSGWLPSISLGWGLNSLSDNNPRVFDADGDAFELPRVKESQSWYVGLQWDDVFWQGNAFGMAVGQPTFATEIACGDVDRDFCDSSPSDGNYAWEWWYKWQVTDNISITPALFYLSRPLGQYTANLSDGKVDRDRSFDLFGGLLQATFKF